MPSGDMKETAESILAGELDRLRGNARRDQYQIGNLKIQLIQHKSDLAKTKSELEKCKGSFSFRLGNLFVKCIENPATIIGLPKSVTKLVAEYYRHLKDERREAVGFSPKKSESRSGDAVAERREILTQIWVYADRTSDNVEKCIDSILACRTMPFELWAIAADCGARTTRRLHDLERCGKIKLLPNGVPQGAIRAINEALENSRFDYIAVLDGNVCVTSGWLEKLIRCAQVDKATAVVGPLSNHLAAHANFAAHPIWSAPAGEKGIGVEVYAQAVEQASVKEYPLVHHFDGSCVLIDTRAAKKIGLLETENTWTEHAAIADFCLRAAQNGLKCRLADDTFVDVANEGPLRNAMDLAVDSCLCAKHGKPFLEAIAVQTGKDDTLKRIARRIDDYCDQISDIRKIGSAKIVFVLPGKGGNGGTNSVVQEVNQLRKFGIDARIVNYAENRSDFMNFYPGCENFTIFANSRKDLIEAVSENDLAIATMHSTVEILKEAREGSTGLCLAYYIQDYEVMFFGKGSTEYESAFASYEKFGDATFFAKTRWLIDTLDANHGVQVRKVAPSLDTRVYNPFIKIDNRDKRPVSLCAMVRTRSNRRAPLETLRLLRRLKLTLGDRVRVLVFGSSDGQIKESGARLDFEFSNLGILKSDAVRRLLLKSDIFIDFSIYQAFGRTGLEAMASGCVPVLPSDGGVREYAVDNFNSKIIDTSDLASAERAISELILSGDQISRLQKNGLQTAKDYSVREAAFSELLLFHSILRKEKSKQKKIRIGYKYSRKKNGCPSGTAYIRILSPLNAVCENDSTYTAVRVSDNTIDSMGIDILFTHRDAMTVEQANRTKKKGIKLVYDIDDDIFAGKPSICELMRLADRVTVTNSTIENTARIYSENVVVVPNFLDKKLWFGFGGRSRNISEEKKSPCFVFLGTNSHSTNLSTIKEDLTKFCKKFSYRFLTNIDFDLGVRLEIETDNYPNYIKQIYEKLGDPHFGIAVLDLTDFNFCKSYLKYLEYTAMGLPAVYSYDARLDFSKVVVDGWNGICVNKNDTWEESLQRMLNEETRQLFLKNAINDVEQNHTMEKRGVLIWKEIFDGLVTRKIVAFTALEKD